MIEGAVVAFARVHLFVFCCGVCVIAALNGNRFFDYGGHAPSGAAEPGRGKVWPLRGGSLIDWRDRFQEV